MGIHQVDSGSTELGRKLSPGRSGLDRLTSRAGLPARIAYRKACPVAKAAMARLIFKVITACDHVVRSRPRVARRNRIAASTVDRTSSSGTATSGEWAATHNTAGMAV
jgi:hypothetical protein